MTVQRLSALDVGFLALETDEAPLHIGALLVLEGPRPDEDAVRAELARRASAVHLCRQRVGRPTSWLRRAVWLDDVGFDASSHLHCISLPPDSGPGSLERRVVELMGVRLDTSQPLWEVWQIDGLPDGSWALLVKAHHSLIDGVSGAGLLSALLAMGAAPGVPGQAPVVVPRVPLRERVRRLRQGARTVAVPDLPPTVLNGPLAPGRTWGWCDVELADLQRVAAADACSINDVYLAALSGALRTVLVDRSVLGPGARVRTLVPVSLRRGGADLRIGNLDSAFFVELPVHLCSVEAMLRDVTAQTARAKAEAVSLGTEQLLRSGDLVPAPVLERAARAYVRRGQSRVNFVATDVRGPAARLEVCGRSVRDIVPCIPLALQVRTVSALLSYADRAAVSFTVDGSLSADAETVAAAFRDSFDELVHGLR